MTIEQDVPRAKFAEQLARGWHDGQVDAVGKPYILHVEAVAGSVYDMGESYQVVAWLHDTIEDTAIPADAFTYLADVEREAVFLLTRKHAEEYAQYIDRLCKSGNALAIQVKAADLRHNLSRIDQLPKDRADSLRRRYQASLEKVEAVINEEGPGV